MSPSDPCPKCGLVAELETVNPLGIFMERMVLWNCRCGTTRAVEISHNIPQELVRKAMAKDNARESNHRPPDHGIPMVL